MPTAKKTISSTAGKKKKTAPVKKNTTEKKTIAPRTKNSRAVKAVAAALPVSRNVAPVSLFSDFDIELFKVGKHFRLYEKLGAHEMEYEGVRGVYFAVWAPDAAYVGVMGDFNGWSPDADTLLPRWDNSGIWEGFIGGLQNGALYKYAIRGNDGHHYEKGDPYANFWEVRPRSASIVWNMDYKWKDGKWMKGRKKRNSLQSPFSVYEVHLASWRRPDPDNHEIFYSYREIAEKLVPYVSDMGFTHIELMPVMEHPYDGSWGYQGTGYYAPTSRFGSPQEFMEMVDDFHQAGIGVILDWVPSHFPYDAHGLFKFDGSHVYEYADMRQGYQPDWNSYIFNYKRNEVRAFLVSNALFWLDKFHVDGLRVDAVASMIYVDYSRQEGGWVANEFGGRENLEAISFLRELNETIYANYPDVQTIAEESTAFYGVSRPVFMGGLGFGMKWMMGWMNDTLDYFKKDPYYRQWHQNELTFSIIYAFSENFMLPLSHDEVVHGKAPMIYKMPGDEWQKFANLRLLYTYMFTHPGTKLLFMGDEFGQTTEWNYKRELQWDLLQYPPHSGLQSLVRELNHLYETEPALHENQFEARCFQWVDISDQQNSVMIYSRSGNKKNERLLIALNLTPVPREYYKVGLEEPGAWKECFNSDNKNYWGSGVGNEGVLKTKKEKYQDREYTLTLTLPPLSGIVLRQV